MNSISDDKKIWRKLKFRTGRQTPASPLRLGISHFQVDYRGIIVKAIQPLSLLKIYCTDFSSTPYLIHLTLCPLHPMLRVNVMLDFICMGFVAPQGTRSTRIQWDSNSQPSDPQTGALTHWSTQVHVEDHLNVNVIHVYHIQVQHLSTSNRVRFVVYRNYKQSDNSGKMKCRFYLNVYSWNTR